ncbi:MAG: phosphoribosylanthranilate isomerase [bacterium]|nr:phosphoribosylanthranilate isomerase [bacterium]
MRTRVKICGLTQADQAQAIARMGADALGFILYPKSPRYVAPERLPELTAGLPPLITLVGVFVNETKERVLAICQRYGLDLAQLHGEESPEYCDWLSAQGQRWIKAFRVGGPEDLAQMDAYGAGFILLDAKSNEAYGGTGEVFDWSLARQAKGERRIILAGGLGEHNLEEALSKLRPYGVDLSSRIEISPGIKDLEATRRIFQLMEQL